MCECNNAKRLALRAYPFALTPIPPLPPPPNRRERDEAIHRLHEDNRSLATVGRSLQAQVESLAVSNATAPARVEGLTVELASERERCARAVGELRRSEATQIETLSAYERMRNVCAELETRLAALSGVGGGAGGGAGIASGANAGARQGSRGDVSATRRTSNHDYPNSTTKRAPFVPAMRKALGAQRTSSRGGGGGGGATAAVAIAAAADRSRGGTSGAARAQALEARLQDIEAAVAANAVLSPLLTHSPGNFVASLDPEVKSKLIAALVGSSPTRTGQLFPPSSPTLSLGSGSPVLPGEWPTTLPKPTTPGMGASRESSPRHSLSSRQVGFSPPSPPPPAVVTLPVPVVLSPVAGSYGVVPVGHSPISPFYDALAPVPPAPHLPAVPTPPISYSSYDSHGRMALPVPSPSVNARSASINPTISLNDFDSSLQMQAYQQQPGPSAYQQQPGPSAYQQQPGPSAYQQQSGPPDFAIAALIPTPFVSSFPTTTQASAPAPANLSVSAPVARAIKQDSLLDEDDDDGGGYGRNYYRRYDYENLESADADKVFERIESQFGVFESEG